MTDMDKQQGARPDAGKEAGKEQGARKADGSVDHSVIPVPTPPQGRHGTGEGRDTHTGAVTGSPEKS